MFECVTSNKNHITKNYTPKGMKFQILKHLSILRDREKKKAMKRLEQAKRNSKPLEAASLKKTNEGVDCNS